MEDKTCYIFSAGAFYGLTEVPKEGDLIIAADAGYRYCRQLGIKPDLLIGDFDSMDEPDDFENIMRLPVVKDDTDTMMSIKKALETDYKRIVIYGGCGGERSDHFLANIQGLAYVCRHGARAFMYDKNFVYTVIENSEIKIRKTVEDGLVSVFAMDAEVLDVCESGMQYSLDHGTLNSYMPLGVSNHFRENYAVISCGKGLLLVGWVLKTA